MKIGIVTPFISSNVDLAFYASQHLNIAAELAKCGDEVVIFTLNRDSSRYFRKTVFVKGERIDVHFLESGSRVLERINLPFFRDLSRHLASIRFDILQVSEDTQLSTVQAAMITSGSPLTIFQGVNHYSYNSVKRLAMRMFDLVLGSAVRSRTRLVIAKTHEAEEFMRKKGYLRIITIPMGVDNALFKKHSLTEGREFLLEQGVSLGKMNLLYVGNLIARRDIKTLLQALSYSNRGGMDANLVIVGKGPEKESLMRLRKELDLAGRVFFLDQVENAKMPLVYSAVDAFVFCPLHEIFGMVILEAMACELPVICTRISAVRDIISNHRENGFLLTGFQDPLGLADAFLRLWRSQELCGGLGRVNRHIAEQHSWNKIALRMRNAYAEVI